jgi:hypothetical protein
MGSTWRHRQGHRQAAVHPGGFAGFLLLTPLAATSFKPRVKALGAKRWQALHKLVYVIAGLGILHFFWMRAGKNNFGEVAIYAAILGRVAGLALVQYVRKGRSPAPPVASRRARGNSFRAEAARSGPAPFLEHLVAAVSRSRIRWARAPSTSTFGGAAARVVVAGHAHAISPADITASRSPGGHGQRAVPRPIQSPLSHTGPTTS